jgi:hypothetical protein
MSEALLPLAADVPQAPQSPEQRIAEFDTDMRSSGLQHTNAPPAGEVDERSLNHLVSLRKSTPLDQQTTKWRETWERDYAQTLDGRRYGESRADFEARQRGGSQPVSPQDELNDMWASVPQAKLESAVESVHVASQPNKGWANAEHFDPVLLSGYTLPPGHSYEAEMTIKELAAAREAGITQEQVNRVVAARLKK